MFQIRNSEELWVLEAQTGLLFHDGETGQLMAHTAQINDTLTLLYNGNERTLAISYNDEVELNGWILICSLNYCDLSQTPSVKFFNISAPPGKVLSPVILCDRALNKTKVQNVSATVLDTVNILTSVLYFYVLYIYSS